MVLSERNINFGLRSIALGLTALPFPHTKSYQFAQAKVFFQKKDEWPSISCSPDIGPLSLPWKSTKNWSLF